MTLTMGGLALLPFLWHMPHNTAPDVDAKSGDWGRATRYQSPQLTRTGVVPGMSERPPSVEKVQFLPLCRWWCDQPDLPSTTSSARRSTLEQERVQHFGETFYCLCSFKSDLLLQMMRALTTRYRMKTLQIKESMHRAKNSCGATVHSD